MSEPIIEMVPDPRMPRDMILAIDDDDQIVGGARKDELEGWIVYTPDEARGMADVLNLPYARPAT